MDRLGRARLFDKQGRLLLRPSGSDQPSCSQAAFFESPSVTHNAHKYLDIARITDLVRLTTSSDDVQESKPAPTRAG
jgi:hypothetical protein